MHRTQTKFEDAFTLKVFIFQFVNFYSSPIYIAFFKGRSAPLPPLYPPVPPGGHWDAVQTPREGGCWHRSRGWDRGQSWPRASEQTRLPAHLVFLLSGGRGGSSPSSLMASGPQFPSRFVGYPGNYHTLFGVRNEEVSVWGGQHPPTEAETLGRAS